MTEKTDTNKRLKTALRPGRFAIAVVAPLFVTAGLGGLLLIFEDTAFAAFVLIYATVFGGVYWLFLTAPALIWAIRRGRTHILAFCGVALLANLLATVIAASLHSLDRALPPGQAYLIFGSVFGLIWTVIFVLIYAPTAQAAKARNHHAKDKPEE
ncbi:MAG: hypothetical protein AAFY03_00930 [Pseudomonadota bacterium]